ncbi:MAG: hypothetical protein ACKVPX_07320 [Myxococcaceae bacterium]
MPFLLREEQTNPLLLRVSRDPELEGAAIAAAGAQNAVAPGWQHLALSLEVTAETLSQPVYVGVTNVGFGGVAVFDDFQADSERHAH